MEIWSTPYGVMNEVVAQSGVDVHDIAAIGIDVYKRQPAAPCAPLARAAAATPCSSRRQRALPKRCAPVSYTHLNTCKAVLVVQLALLRVRKHLVCFVYFLELFLGVLIAGVIRCV